MLELGWRFPSCFCFQCFYKATYEIYPLNFLSVHNIVSSIFLYSKSPEFFRLMVAELPAHCTVVSHFHCLTTAPPTLNNYESMFLLVHVTISPHFFVISIYSSLIYYNPREEIWSPLSPDVSLCPEKIGSCATLLPTPNSLPTSYEVWDIMNTASPLGSGGPTFKSLLCYLPALKPGIND